MSNIKPEQLIEEKPIPVSIEGAKKILFQMENCICKIYLKNVVKGTGFFCKIPFNNNLLPVLITNNHVLKENNIEDNNIIELSINNDIKEIEIDNLRKRYTNSDKNIDITIIEIRPNKDGINNYLELDDNNIYQNEKNLKLEYKNKSKYILQYPREELKDPYGLINNIIDNKEISHFCKTEEGSSGSPILSLKTFKVIGIHYGSISNLKINNGTSIKYVIDLFSEYNNKNKNEINIIYEADEEGFENIFGDEFVKNNRNNIELIINGNKNNLVEEYKLKKGENKVKIIIKNKITNLEKMFYECKSLKNIEELKYLDTKEIKDFSLMFAQCSLISDIKGLENWNVSNGNDFSCMFYECSSLSDIKVLQNWNVSNGNDFSSMFEGCTSLSDIKALENWNVSNGNDFSSMFKGCSSLSDIKALENWNVSNGKNFRSLFLGCSSLLYINELKNWNVSNGNDFSSMFKGCSSLSDIKVLQNWNVSNGDNFSCMFEGCSSLCDIKGLQNWNVSNGYYFSYMFSRCLSLSDIKGLKNWDVSIKKEKELSNMFYGCLSLCDIKGLLNWNLFDWIYEDMISNSDSDSDYYYYDLF